MHSSSSEVSGESVAPGATSGTGVLTLVGEVVATIACGAGVVGATVAAPKGATVGDVVVTATGAGVSIPEDGEEVEPTATAGAKVGIMGSTSGEGVVAAATSGVEGG